MIGRIAPDQLGLNLPDRVGVVRKLLTVCLCGFCPGRLVSFVFDGGCAAEAGVDAAAVVEVFDPGGDRGVDLAAGGEGTRSARPSAHSAGVVVHGGEEGAGFSQELVLLLQLAHPPTWRSVRGFQLAWIRATLTRGLTPLALECDPPAHHRFAQLSIPGHRRDQRPCIQHQTRHITTILRCQTTTSSHHRCLTGRRHSHPLNEVSTTQA